MGHSIHPRPSSLSTHSVPLLSSVDSTPLLQPTKKNRVSNLQAKQFFVDRLFSMSKIIHIQKKTVVNNRLMALTQGRIYTSIFIYRVIGGHTIQNSKTITTRKSANFIGQS
jgi:hypothetical protein